MAGYDYYPGHGTEDWNGTYESYDAASAKVKIIDLHKCKIDDCEYDWFEIIDLKDWIE